MAGKVVLSLLSLFSHFFIFIFSFPKNDSRSVARLSYPTVVGLPLAPETIGAWTL
jgi:hypothetical protein